ncbi:MAG: dihydroorotate dehydrogenase [Candidatus Eisenbacteria bacterium]|nr:dihydroorotate dehydrogenase [Candidatus Eisenbacteria bacterium]
MSLPDLAVTVGSLDLANPVLCASGTFGYGIEHPEIAARLGAVVTKTITREPREGNAPPRVAETPSGMLNSIGLQNVGVERFVREKLPPLLDLGVPAVVSVGGRSADDFEDVIRTLDRARGISAYELNISCPNVKEGGLEFCASPAAAADLVRRCRGSTERPLWAKLSPSVTSIGALARACVDAGADAITAVNTFVGLALDLEERRPRLRNGVGGLSGPAIRPLALARVREVVRAVSVPVIGVGGIVTGRDALEFLLVGARAVQVGTGSFLRPDQPERVIDEIAAFLAARSVRSIDEWTGSLRDWEESR